MDDDADGEGAPTVTARTASATASSSREASKKMLSATEMTRSVTGGRAGGTFELVLALGLVLVEEGG